MIKIFITILIFHFYSSKLFNQELKIPKIKIASGVITSTSNQAPFWLVSNKYGLIRPSSFNAYLKPGLFGKAEVTRWMHLSYGLEVVNRYSEKNELYLHQGFGKLHVGPISLEAGWLEESFGNQDSLLSSGGLLWSGNTRPLPKVTIGIRDFTDIPFTKGYAEIKGGLSHGWFGENKFSKKVWLHHKYVHMRFGGKLPIHLEGGMHHYVQWAGVVRDSVQLPKSLLDYYHLFWAYSASEGPSGETNNRLGNHLGTMNLGIDYTGNKFKVLAYWQNIFEDQSGLQFKNIRDGLWGLKLDILNEKSVINGVLIEYIHTHDQSGPLFIPVRNGAPDYGRGNDNYFNNYLYRFGWTHKEMTIGTPLITSPAFLEGDTRDYIRNNKIEGYHVGINGRIKKFHYKVFYTYTNNYGTYYFPFDNQLAQHSMLIQTKLQDVICADCNVGLGVGLDRGKFLGNHAGIEINFEKRFNIVK